MRWILLMATMLCAQIAGADPVLSVYSNPRISPSPAMADQALTFTIHVEEGLLDGGPPTITRNADVVTITQDVCYACTSPAIPAHDKSFGIGTFSPGQYSVHLVGIAIHPALMILPVDAPFVVLGETNQNVPALTGVSLILLSVCMAIAGLFFFRRKRMDVSGGH